MIDDITKEVFMRDSDWKIIYELHQNPSITKVSGLLYKSQSAITKRLQSMEEEDATGRDVYEGGGVPVSDGGKVSAAGK